MKRYTCRSCGFEGLSDPGERCPGCGHLSSYLNHQPQWTQEALEAAQQEVAIRRLTCALVKQDDQKDGAMMQCTITNRNLRLRPCGFYSNGKAVNWPRRVQSPFEIVLPYGRLKTITQGTHMGRPARFFTYHHDMIGPLNLWFFVDRGAAAHCGDVDRQVMETVSAFLQTNENRCSSAASEGNPVRT